MKSFKSITEIFTRAQMKKAIGIARKSKGQYTKAYNEIEKIKKGLGDEHIVANALKKANEDTVDEARKIAVKDFRQVIKIAIKHTNNMQQAIKDIEKVRKGLSNHPDVMDILKKANEDIAEAVNLKALQKKFDRNEDQNRHTENYLLLAKTFGTPKEVKAVEKIMKASDKRKYLSVEDSRWLYDNLSKYFRKVYPTGKRESVDEVVGPFQQVSKLLIKYGNNPKEVKRMMTKHMPYVTKKYPNASPAKVAEIISSLSATEELEEGKVFNKDRGIFKALLNLSKKKEYKKVSKAFVNLTTPSPIAKDKEIAKSLSKRLKQLADKLGKKEKAHVLRMADLASTYEEVEIDEANLTKTQIKKVHDKADELPKHDFIKRYGKDGDAVRYATATNIVKKKLGIEEERSPEVAGVLKKYIIGHPLRWSSKEGKKNKKDFIKLQNLALTDMGKFRKKFADMEVDKGDDNYNQQAVRDVLAKAGLSKHLPK